MMLTRIKKILEINNIDLVLDVGANIGQFSKGIRENGYKGKNVSFKPLLNRHKLLSKNAIQYKNWVVAPQMVIGETEMIINISEYSYSSSLLPILNNHIRPAPESNFIDSEKINVFYLDKAASKYIDEKIISI